MNHPVPVSRKGAGDTCCCLPPAGQVTVTSAATSETTSATAGLARSKISCTEGAASARPGTARNSRLATHVRILEILYLAKGKPGETQKKAPGGWPLEPGSTTKCCLLHQAHCLDGLRLGAVHVPGLAGRLGIADQLRRVADRRRRLGTGERPRSLNVLTSSRSLDVLTRTRGLNVLTSSRSLDVLTRTRGLNVL